MTDPQTEPFLLAVCADPAKDRQLLTAAARLAVDLNLPFLEKPKKTGFDALLVVTPQRLELRVLKGDAQLKGGHPIAVQLGNLDIKSGAGRSLKQPIAKAVGVKGGKSQAVTVIDATGGWGEDSWLLAALGCHVLACERNKVVAMLLRDGLLRAGVGNPAMLGRVTVVQTDARHMLRRLARMKEYANEPMDDLPPEMKDFLSPDVVFLDPMFPPGRKTAERKPMRVLRKLVGDDRDAGELLDWALRLGPRRVVVKRPAKSDPLGPKPTTTHKGKGVRYDVYVPKKK